MTKAEWTVQDQAAAFRQGWSIFQLDEGGWVLEALDDPHGIAKAAGREYTGPVFKSPHRDDKARRYIEVNQDDPLCKKALAFLTRTRSFIAVYRSTGSHTLLGGVKKSQSSRWQSHESAMLFLDGSIERNGGPEQCTGEVIESQKAPELLIHCGCEGNHDPTLSNGLGSKCFGCGRTIEQPDINNAEAIWPKKKE